ncbi:MAG: hypothetical protein R3F60_33495 [bacterium]
MGKLLFIMISVFSAHMALAQEGEPEPLAEEPAPELVAPEPEPAEAAPAEATPTEAAPAEAPAEAGLPEQPEGVTPLGDDVGKGGGDTVEMAVGKPPSIKFTGPTSGGPFEPGNPPDMQANVKGDSGAQIKAEFWLYPCKGMTSPSDGCEQGALAGSGKQTVTIEPYKGGIKAVDWQVPKGLAEGYYLVVARATGPAGPGDQDFSTPFLIKSP